MSLLTYITAQKQYVIRASAGDITSPVSGSWLGAYALWLGSTNPTGSWIQTICEAKGIMQPVNGSWVQALALYYGITQPVGGNWWIALALGPVEPVTSDWILETGVWRNGETVWRAEGIWKTV